MENEFKREGFKIFLLLLLSHSLLAFPSPPKAREEDRHVKRRAARTIPLWRLVILYFLMIIFDSLSRRVLTIPHWTAVAIIWL